MTSPDDPIVAASAFAAALSPAGFDLDFSLHSLEIEVDRVLSLPLFRRNKKDPTIEQGRHEAALTAYIGETLRRIFDGRWFFRAVRTNPDAGWPRRREYLKNCRSECRSGKPGHRR